MGAFKALNRSKILPQESFEKLDPIVNPTATCVRDVPLTNLMRIKQVQTDELDTESLMNLPHQLYTSLLKHSPFNAVLLSTEAMWKV